MGGLEVREWVVAVGGGELAQQVLAHLRRLVEHDLRAAGAGRRPVEPSPNRRCSSLARCPSSAPKTSSTLVPKNSATILALSRERGLDLARDLLELVADELRVDRRLLALEHPSADLDRV